MAKRATDWAGLVRQRLRLTGDAEASYSSSYAPSPKQAEFHSAGARRVMFGGSAGPGKSRAIREDALRFCKRHPGANVLLLRRTYAELMDTHWIKMRIEWAGEPCRFVKSDRTVEFLNGSRIVLGHCASVGDEARYLGSEYDRIYFDELTTFEESQYDAIIMRCRTVRRDLVPQVKAATNPGSVGHAWVRARWIDGRLDPNDDPTAYQFIPASLEDHPDAAFVAQYRAELMTKPEKMRRAYLDGRWDVFEGQYFSDWSEAVHVVPAARLPALSGWLLARGMDYGATAPFACYWGALDPNLPRTAREARIVIYREHYAPGQGLAWHAARITEATRRGDEQMVASVADPSMWGSSQADRSSLATAAAEYGLAISPANNDRIAGWRALSELLLPREDGLPGLLVSSDCPNLIRTLPNLVHDKLRPEDLDTTGEDHAADALRYLVMALLSIKRRPRIGGWQ